MTDRWRAARRFAHDVANAGFGPRFLAIVLLVGVVAGVLRLAGIVHG